MTLTRARVARPPGRYKQSRESGTALLIALFALLLVGVVAIALIVNSGTETALSGNYRTATTAYYDALAGLEEARGRLLPRNPDFLNKTIANFIPPGGLGPTDVRYIINPLGAEAVNPQDTATSTTYADLEYAKEFGGPPPTAPAPINSVSANNNQNLPGPLYKWVRINAITEQSLNTDIDGDGSIDPGVLYYDITHRDAGNNPQPSLTTATTWPAVQVYEITALAVLPNGSQKILQYLVAPAPLDLRSVAPNLVFPAALTLDGNNVSYGGPTGSAFMVNGNDTKPTDTPPRSCATAPLAPVPAIGYTNSSDSSYNQITSGIPGARSGNYEGAVPPAVISPTPVVAPVSLDPNFQTPSRLELLASRIADSADVTFSGSADSLTLPTNSSPANPLTIVVNGDLDFTSWHHAGYGLLLVRGTLTYDPDASWYGVVMVIGKGIVTGAHSGTGGFYGAFFVAKTRDNAGNVLPDPGLGSSLANFSASGSIPGFGIHYDSCSVALALSTPPSYKVLSFHEISQ